jgi:hypothetical protein
MIAGLTRWTETPGPVVTFQCARCKNLVTGSSRKRDERVYALGFIPTVSKTTTYVTCGGCKADFLSKLNLSELEQHKGVDISRYLYLTNSLVTLVLVVASAMLFWTPIVGLILAGIAVAITWKYSGGWMKMLSRIALGLAVLVSIALVLLGVFAK